jgi:hypothetical protein
MPEMYNHECIICGKKYKYCDKCKQYGNWRTIADVPEHYQLHLLIQEHRNDIISDDEFIEAIARHDITSPSDYKDFLPEVSKYIDDVFTKTKKNKNKGR